MLKHPYHIVILYFLLCSSCLKETEYTPTQEDTNKIINEWIYKAMYDYYYWETELLLKPNYFENPADFFNSLLSSKDRFSWIINNKEDNLNHLHGIKKNYGFEYVLAYSDSVRNNLIGIVLYTHIGSDARIADIKRGDVFDEINNVKITIDNYSDLLASDKADFTFHRYTNDSSFVKEINARELKINPIQVSQIYEIENTKIGYICYTQFLLDNGEDNKQYKYDLLNCFENFKNEDINELVIDFRYNPGGLIDLAVLFSSLIVPDTTQIALRIDYNGKLNELYRKQGINSDLKFKSHPQSYIGDQLKRVFIITGASTASASEAVINILLPYIDVVLIGEKTYGKNYGSTMFTDQHNSNNTWVIQPIILKMLNAHYKSDYDNGFKPNYAFNEFSAPLVELGNPKEPLLNISISIINNENLINLQKTKQVMPQIEYNSIDRQIQSLPATFIEFSNEKNEVFRVSI